MGDIMMRCLSWTLPLEIARGVKSADEAPRGGDEFEPIFDEFIYVRGEKDECGLKLRD